MTRDEVLDRLGQCLVYLQNNSNIAVILPNFNEVRRFSKDFYHRLDQLPAWLGVSVERRTVRQCDWLGGRILFVSNPDQLKGWSMNVIYRSQRALTQAGARELDYFNFLAAIAQQPIIDFDDE